MGKGYRVDKLKTKSKLFALADTPNIFNVHYYFFPDAILVLMLF